MHAKTDVQKAGEMPHGRVLHRAFAIYRSQSRLHSFSPHFPCPSLLPGYTKTDLRYNHTIPSQSTLPQASNPLKWYEDACCPQAYQRNSSSFGQADTSTILECSFPFHYPGHNNFGQKECP